MVQVGDFASAAATPHFPEMSMSRVTRACFALSIFVATSSTLSAQQSIYMLVDPIKGVEPAPHSGEFKLNSFSSASANSVSISSVTSGATLQRKLAAGI